MIPFIDTHPHLMKEWDESNTLEPSKLSRGSHKKVLWVCENNHQWESKIKTRTEGHGCPYCSGKKVTREDSLLIKNPGVARQWSQENSSSPRDYSPSSNAKVMWKCDEGHTWKAAIMDRAVKGTGCPVCSGRVAEKGVNDLETLSPLVAREWNDPDKKPSQVTPNSSYIAEWICPSGHETREKVRSRNNRKSIHCPVCKQEEKQRKELIDSVSFTIRKRMKDMRMYESLLRRGGVKTSRLLKESFPYLFSQIYNKDKYDGVSYNSAKKVTWVCDNGHHWDTTVYQRVNSNTGCPYCFPSGFSYYEKEITSLLINKGIEVVENDRSLIHPHELDIYIPEKKIAIEFNGLYWHSEVMGKDRNYHYNKWKKCKDKGIQLITIWEDEWKYKREIATSMILHKIGCNRDDKVYSRNTNVLNIEHNEAYDFHESNHIQGGVSGSFHVALESDGHVVAVSTWRKNKNTLYLDRYSSSCTVVGGMGKLLKQGIQYAGKHDCTEIVTFADHQVSNGGLYEKLGFVLDKEIRPDYKYVVNGHREHKFNYRLKRFRNDSDLIYVDGMSERELADLNGIRRVWDCGKSRYVFDMT